EMLFGATPFYHANHREQGRRIISEDVQFPEDYEQSHPAVCSLIRKLLEKDPALRLASFAEVKKTTFFRSYFPSTQGWQQLEARQVEAPFVPRLDGLFDTSLFVRVQDEEQDYGSDADSDFGY
ncbi:Protein kinase, partial [Phytophthora palmivora]